MKKIMSQSPQIGANFRTCPTLLLQLSRRECLNPLKSGQTSGPIPVEDLGYYEKLVSIPSNRGKLPDAEWGSPRRVFLQSLNPLKSGQTSGPTHIAAMNDCISMKSQSPQIGANFRTRGESRMIVYNDEYSQSSHIGANLRTCEASARSPPDREVSIPSNRGKLPDANQLNRHSCYSRCLNPLKSGQTSGHYTFRCREKQQFTRVNPRISPPFGGRGKTGPFFEGSKWVNLLKFHWYLQSAHLLDGYVGK